MSSRSTSAGVHRGTASTPGLIAHLGPEDLEAQLRRDALEGLTGSAKSIPSKWFYDHRGSKLFDEITRLPEYYLTRAERQILRERASTIVADTEADSMVELGCGLSEKTQVLLDAFHRSGSLDLFVPFDVDGKVLQEATEILAGRYPELMVQGVVGDFERHLEAIDVPGRALTIFLGSTIGNLNPGQRSELLGNLAASMDTGDSFLLGVDLVKDPRIIEAAYNDSMGVSAAFNLNMLRVLNHRLEGNIDVDGFEHVARFDADSEQMVMNLRSRMAQRAYLAAIDLDLEFEAGEAIHTEISAKFRRESIEAELRAAGLAPRRWWTDAGDNFALSLSFKA